MKAGDGLTWEIPRPHAHEYMGMPREGERPREPNLEGTSAWQVANDQSNGAEGAALYSLG
jgi:hypothetical protein